MRENRLAKEKSPYLRQHRSNPVDWYPWGEEAFEKARTEQKPLFLSIGYSTCYWCHVMEKDSFESDEVAATLNSSFVSIKVDREERPDVDAIYMDAVIACTGHGGWPMSVFLTPDRKPFFGGTFFPRAQFLKLLENVNDAWQKRRDGVIETSEEIFSFLEAHRAHQSAANAPIVAPTVFTEAAAACKRSFDTEWGGFGPPPKFPPTSTIPFLLRTYRRSGDEELLRMSVRTLDAIARGGIHDHLGGGFHRYATDQGWTIPHFEKMLYDNALLCMCYLEAHQLNGNRMFSVVAHDTLNYILREMTSPEGGFFTAQDAGEVGKEGEFYVWTEKQLRSLVDDEQFAVLRKVFEIDERGNFEHGSIVLRQPLHTDWHLKEDPRFEEAHHILFLNRSRRAHPHRDEKILTGWNGLAISAFAKGYEVLGEERFLKAAQKAADFVLTRLRPKGKLLRRYCDGEAAIPACLEDYSYFIKSLLDLFQADFDERWYKAALELQDLQDSLFLDKTDGGYFSANAGDTSLILRKKEFFDGALPNPNGIAFLNLLRFFHLTGDNRYRETARTGMKAAARSVTKAPIGGMTVLSAYELDMTRTLEVVVVGSEGEQERAKAIQYLRRTFLPNVTFVVHDPAKRSSSIPILQGKEASGAKSAFYVCSEQTCKAPVYSAAELTESLIHETKEKR